MRILFIIAVCIVIFGVINYEKMSYKATYFRKKESTNKTKENDMARYIDAEKVMEEIERIGGHNLCEWETIGVKALIDRQPTADVVPKSECSECAEKTRNTIVKLQDHIKLLKKYDEERDIALHARLIAETRKEVAREIFAEIEKHKTVPFGSKCEVIPLYIVSELKKKYTGEK